MKRTALFLCFIICTAFSIADDTPKYTLIVFSGSDWCKNCIRLKRETLDSEKVSDFLTSEEVEVYVADFPRKKKNKPSEDVARHNEKLAEQFNLQGEFPKLVLLDDSGKKVYMNSGFISSEKLVDSLEEILR